MFLLDTQTYNYQKSLHIKLKNNVFSLFVDFSIIKSLRIGIISGFH